MKYLIIALILLCAGTAFGQTKYLLAKAPVTDYYVDGTAGNNASAGISWATAWADMTNVSGSTASGSTVHIRNMDKAISKSDWPDRVYYAIDVNQFGAISWTFSTETRIGQFANRDIWVQAPVTISYIFPVTMTGNGSATTRDYNDYTSTYETWTVQSGRTIHGSVVNPVGGGSQGWDTYLPYWSEPLNVGADLPLTITTAKSLVSSVSRDEAGSLPLTNNDRPKLDTVAVLTILESVPAFGSFRPAYSGTNKTVTFNKSDLRYDLLGTLSLVASMPTITEGASDIQTASYERMFERPWLDSMIGWQGRAYHPIMNMPDYGQTLAVQTGIGGLLLQMDYTNSEKEKLLIRYVQVGLDNYGILASGQAGWPADGGHSIGRKLPILIAAVTLDDSTMTAMFAKTGDYFYQNGKTESNPPSDNVYFAEDDCTFYVAESDVCDVPLPYYYATTYGNYYPSYAPADIADYTSYHIGMPEWGIRHNQSGNYQRWDTPHWTDGPYRTINGFTFGATALAALACDSKTLWNHNVFFDYTDRYMDVTKPGGQFPGVYPAGFVANVWTAHRASLGTVWTGTYDVEPPGAPTGLTVTVNTGGSISLSWTAPVAGADGNLATAYRIFRVPNDSMFYPSGDIGPALYFDWWTFTNGWSGGTWDNYKMTKVSNENIGTATPSAVGIPFAVGIDHKVSITASGVSGSITYTYGGVAGTAISNGTIVDNIYPVNYNKFSLTGGVGSTAVITAITITPYVYCDLTSGMLDDSSTGTTYVDSTVEVGEDYRYMIFSLDAASIQSIGWTLIGVTAAE
jgi:hypothetical protein